MLLKIVYSFSGLERDMFYLSAKRRTVCASWLFSGGRLGGDLLGWGVCGELSAKMFEKGDDIVKLLFGEGIFVDGHDIAIACKLDRVGTSDLLAKVCVIAEAFFPVCEEGKLSIDALECRAKAVFASEGVTQETTVLLEQTTCSKTDLAVEAWCWWNGRKVGGGGRG